jgi:D-alanyl-lipoteichoic acid acyltransferase DltB (MBOAT superfamily)
VIFPTVRFAIFFSIVLPLSWLLMRRRGAWRALMLVASYIFYGFAGWWYMALLGASTVANQGFALAIDRSKRGGTKRAWLVVAVAANLGALAYYKYTNLLLSSANNLAADLGWHWKLPLANIALPAAISFFTFQALSYVIDTFRGKIRPVSFGDFAVYLSFFPHLLAGPIVRAAEFLPQLKTRRDPRKVDSGLAFWLIAGGLFKKLVISTYVAKAIVDPVFKAPTQHLAIDTVLGVYGFAVQIYMDFSAYTDIAIGLAMLLGFRFPQNFDVPYRAASLQEFWRRWHMTLSRWLRDYLYIPLGGNRRKRSRAYFNLMATMVLGGLWHGASWMMLIWGTIHGVGLAVERFFKDLAARRRRQRDERDQRRARAIASLTVAVPAGDSGGGTARVLTGDSAGVLVVDDPDATPASATGGGVGPPGPPAAPPSVERARRRPLTWISTFVTFQVVCVAWVFFRVGLPGEDGTLRDAIQVLSRLGHWGSAIDFNPVLVAVIFGSLALQFWPASWTGRVRAWFSHLHWAAQGVGLALWILGTALLFHKITPSGVAPFIYFKF